MSRLRGQRGGRNSGAKPDDDQEKSEIVWTATRVGKFGEGRDDRNKLVRRRE